MFQKSKKESRDNVAAFLFGAGYGNRTRLLGLGSRCTTDVLTLQSEPIIADVRAQCKAKFARREKEMRMIRSAPS